MCRCQSHQFNALAGPKIATVLLVDRIVPVFVHPETGQSRPGLTWVVEGAGGREIRQSCFVQVILRAPTQAIAQSSGSVVDDVRSLFQEEIITD